MTGHVLFPMLRISQQTIPQDYREYMDNWLDECYDEMNAEIVSSSICAAGATAEVLIHGHTVTDWQGIIHDLLRDENRPLSYSEKYGQLLNCCNYWKQTPVHAIYNQWWALQLQGVPEDFSQEILSLMQPSGWIYNPAVSETNVKYRMRTELFMSMAMGVEIASHCISSAQRNLLISAINSIGRTNYVAAEFFRLKALQLLNATSHMPPQIDEVLIKCKSEPGFADFNVSDKVDEYMGTASRTGRDKAIFSPISTMQALALADIIAPCRAMIPIWQSEVKTFLSQGPEVIPAFKMRDLSPDFGPGATIFEILAAIGLLSL